MPTQVPGIDIQEIMKCEFSHFNVIEDHTTRVEILEVLVNYLYEQCL